MAFKAGTTSKLYIANVAAALQDLSPYTDTFGHTQSVAQLEASAFGTAAKAFITGLTDGDDLTISGPYDVAVFSHYTGLKAGHAAGSAASAFIWGPGGSVASQARVAGTFWVKSFGMSTGVGGRAEYSVSLQVTGAVTNSTF